MARKGVYTKRRTPIDAARWTIRRRWRWFKALSKPKKALVVTGPILAFLILTPLFTYIYYYNDIASQERLMNRNNTGIVLMDKNGKDFFSTGRAEHRKLVPLDQISDVTEKALLSSEDKDFYKHSGFSFFSIVKAMYANILAGSATAYGGSTLTQQLAKNTLLTNNQTILRKYQELTVSMAIEQRYSKDQILDMYLNSVYFGNNSFGIEEAAENYFNKKASDLTLAESSMLIGVLPAPSAYSPVDGSPKLAKERQNTVLTRMVNNSVISELQKDKAVKVALKYAPVKSASDNIAPHFTEMVLNELYDKYGEEKAKRSGYQVRTTLDLTLQKAAVKSVDDGMAHIEANGGSNASLVAIDPNTGEIRALVGSADYDNEQFGKVNMATTKRQPGSSFKPIYYADGLAKGIITPVTVLDDEPTDFNGYKPQNADRSFRGNVTVRQALNWSLNIPSVKVMQKVGINESVDAAQRMGITTLDSDHDYGLSLALGAAEVPLTEMTDAYATFADQGQHLPATTIHSIQNKYSKTIFTSDEKSKQVISAEGAYLISNILSDTATRSVVFGNSLSVYGTDYQLKKVAVKTGTTDDARDAWTIGYTPGIAVGVWVGNNDNAAMLSGGSDMAGPIWRSMMSAAIGSSSPDFKQPSGVVKETICTSFQGIVTDVFLTSAIPTSTCATTQPVIKQKQPEKDADTNSEKDTKKSSTTDVIPPTDTTGDDGTGATGGDGGSDDGSGTTVPPTTTPITP